MQHLPTYLPLIDATLPWIKTFLEEYKTPHQALLLGINGPQGCGKSTLAAHLVAQIPKSVTLSIDDFYLTRDEQIALSRTYPDNPYLQHRGYPGTHDVDLGFHTLENLKHLPSGSVMSLPRYDKTLHAGKGDRAPTTGWPTVHGPLDIIFLEGWMLGFPVLDSPPPGNLELINSLLTKYSKWNELLDGFIFLKPERLEDIPSWRIEAERNTRSSGKPAMSEEEVEAFIQNFMPAYQVYLPALEKNPPVNRALTVACARFEQTV